MQIKTKQQANKQNNSKQQHQQRHDNLQIYKFSSIFQPRI